MNNNYHIWRDTNRLLLDRLYEKRFKTSPCSAIIYSFWSGNMSCLTKSFTLFVMTLLPILAEAQTCQTNNILATTPTNRFTINNDGTVSDKKTGLTWKKCSEGQSGVDCRIGAAATYTWQGALQQAQSVNNNGGFAGYKNWRLPSIKELHSIVEEQCIKPSINLAVFSESQGDVYWSSSSSTYGSVAWYVGFGNGYSGSDYKDGGYFVRLVR